MTKKTKLWLIISAVVVLLLAIGIALFFVFKTDESSTKKLKLDTPTITLQVDGNQKLLISTYNKFASDYAFYIYADGTHPEWTFNYAEFRASKYSSASDSTLKCYLDVTDIFCDAKDYYYCGKLIGNEKYADSDLTEPQKWSNLLYISTPVLAIYDTTLSWSSVSNSSSYEIYANNSLITTTNLLTYDLSTFLSSTTETNFSFKVKALGKEFYSDSELSNVVEYQKQITLSKTYNLSYNSSTNLLEWSTVRNAESYEIIFNNNQVLYSDKSSYDFSQLVNEIGSYTFKVRALKTGILAGEYSDVYTFTKTEKLEKVNVDSISFTIEEDRIMISWDRPENALTYTILINGGDLFASTSFEQDSIYIKKPDVSTLTFEIRVNAFGYYQESSTTLKQITL